jgi:hypothetical protein
MTHMPSSMKFFGRALAVSAIALVCLSSAAEAGFEWRGPLEPAVRKSAPAPIEDDLSGLAPVLSWDGGMPAAVAAPAERVEVLPVNPAPRAEVPVMTGKMNGDTVIGFGRDLPLVIALQQVAPAGHQFSFAAGVNPGTTVSWDGGRSWRGVMKDMLAPRGLGFQKQGNVIVVGFTAMEDLAAPLHETPVSVLSPLPDGEESFGAPLSLTEPAALYEETPPPAPAATPAMAAPAPVPSGDPVTIRRTRTGAERRTAGPRPESVASSSLPGVTSVPPETAGSRAAGVEPRTGMNQTEAEMAETKPAEDMPQVAAMPAPAVVETSAAMAAVPPSAEMAAPGQAPAGHDVAAQAAPLWHSPKEATLRETLSHWSKAANVELYWSIDYDYRIRKDISYAGSYDDAVEHLLDLFASARPQPYGQLHRGGNGSRVLIVKSYDLAS